MSNTILDAALRYTALGMSIIPVAPNSKKAAGQWKRYQAHPADDAQLRQWFANGRGYGMAVVLGAVSGGLVCRDFDATDAYERWADTHPNLAKTLPTVATSRGRHVYFRAASADLRFVDLRTLDPPEDGEYRGDSGHYCLLPPSRHPDGPTYTWLVPPNGAIPLVADVRAAGLLPEHVTERTETTESTEENRRVQKQLGRSVDSVPSVLSVHSVLSVTSDESDPDIDRAILEALPAGVGRRNRQVFELARALKAIPRLADAPVDGMKAYVRRWHGLGMQRGVIGTEPFDETWIDFLNGWPKVKFPRGGEPMAAILERARSRAPVAAANYEGDGLRLLVSLCEELQRASGHAPFFLSCRTAARLLGLDADGGHVKAWRWLGLLVHDGVIDEAEPGDRGKRRAARYRYCGAIRE